MEIRGRVAVDAPAVFDLGFAELQDVGERDHHDVPHHVHSHDRRVLLTALVRSPVEMQQAQMRQVKKG